MKLLLGAIGDTQYVQAVPDGANLHEVIRNLVVGGKRPDVFSITPPLPLIGKNIFLSGRTAAGVIITVTLDLSQYITITNLGDYLQFLEQVKVVIKTQYGQDLRFLHSIHMF